MGKKQTINSLPPGDYTIEEVPVGSNLADNNVLSQLPPGDYSVEEVAAPPSFKSFNPMLTSPDDSAQLEATLNDIVKTSRLGISDSEKDLLRDMLKNPNLTPEQAKESIQAIQGYHPKQRENTFTTPDYYVKTDDNGVVRPIPLGKGERPPKEYNVANVWGQTKKDAADDSWYTDLAKSAVNMLPSLAQSFGEVGDFASNLITGEDSEFFNRVINTSESLKLNKDTDGKTIYNPGEAKKFSELFSSERFDFSPESLWNTVNWAVESIPQFVLGAGEAKMGIKAGKVALNSLRGVETAAELGKVGNATAMLASSFAMQIGENMEASREAGLTGRDAAYVAGAITTVQASLDAFTGLDIGAKLFNRGMVDAQKTLLKNLIKEVPKSADGTITKEGMEMLGKRFVSEYAPMAKEFVKEGIKDTGKEMSQEVLQSFTQRAGQQIWDNLSGDEKAKFGTNAFDAESFGEYLSSGINSLGVAPISMITADPKQKFKDQSVAAMQIIEGGQDKINEFKANIYAAQRKGDITEKERDEAMFKVAQYEKYNEQTKDLTMDQEQRMKAFELSFNIESLKKELPKDTDGMNPISIAKVDAKKELIKGLQTDLNGLLLRQEFQTETIVPDSMVEKMAKAQEKATGTKSLQDLINTFKGKKTGDFVPAQKPKERAKITDFDTDTFNNLSYKNPLEAKKIVQEALKTTEGNEMPVTIRSGQNGVLTMDIGDNKQVRIAQSVQVEGLPSFLKIENIGGNKIEVENRGGDANLENSAMKEFYYDTPAALKRVEIDSFDEDGNPVLDKEGKQMRKAVLPVYNKETGNFIGFQRENRKGESKYTPEEVKQLQKITNANFLTDDIAPFLYKEDKGKYSPEMNQPKAAKAAKVADPVLLQALEQAKRELDIEMASEFGNEENVQAIKAEIARIEGELQPKIKKAVKAEPAPKEQPKEKPKIKPVEPTLPFIKDVEALQKVIPTKAGGEFKGEEVRVAKIQASIRKKLSILEQLSKCVNS